MPANPIKKCLFITLFIFFSLNLYAQENKININDEILVGKGFYKTGNYEQSYNFFKTLFKKYPQNMSVNFYLGRSAFELKKYEESVFIFQRILISHPNLIRIKLEIARSYMALGASVEAKRIFNEVLKQDPPKQVKENIEQLLGVIEAGEQKHILLSSIQLGYGYDNNVNTSPTDQIIEIPLFNNLPATFSDEETDFFTDLNLDITHIYRFESQTLHSLKTSASYFKQYYNSAHEQNLDFFNFNIQPSFTVNSSLSFNTKLLAQHIRIDNEGYLNIFGAGAGVKKRLRSNTLNFNILYLKKNYNDYDKRDADTAGADISFDFNMNKFYLTPFASFSKEWADSDIYTYLRYASGIGFSYIPLSQLIFSSSYRYQYTDYDEEEPLFMKTREDNAHYLTADIKWMFFNNEKISSFIGLTNLYIKNNSNIDIYEYNKNKTSVYVKVNF